MHLQFAAHGQLLGAEGARQLGHHLGRHGVLRRQGIALQPDGKIVVSATASSNVAVLRYTAAGTLDLTFAGRGYLTEYGTTVGAPVLQSDGRILIAGGFSSTQGFVYRINGYGGYDTSFGSGGQLISERCVNRIYR